MKAKGEDYIVESVSVSDDFISISTTSSTGFGLDTKYGVLPEVGDTITLYTKNYSLIRGMDLNGVEIFYKTDEDLEFERAKWLFEENERKQKSFAKNQKKMDKQYFKLPKIFQQRIDRFRANNPTFRVDYESYELFCCEQAVIIAKACKTPEAVQEFYKKGFDEQIKQVKKISKDHSGNTFGCSVNLAYWYLQEEPIVAKLHGALSPLVGSEAYGDHSPEELEKLEK